MKIKRPRVPKKCMGLLPKREIKITDIRSRGPRMKRSIPNLGDHLFANLVEAGPLGQYRNISVHVSVNLNAFHHLPLIGLQTAIEVVQFDARHHSGGPIVKFAGDIF